MSLNSPINLNHTYLYPIVSTIFSLPNLALSNLPPSNRSRSIFPVSNFCEHSFTKFYLPFFTILSLSNLCSPVFSAPTASLPVVPGSAEHGWVTWAFTGSHHNGTTSFFPKRTKRKTQGRRKESKGAIVTEQHLSPKQTKRRNTAGSQRMTK